MDSSVGRRGPVSPCGATQSIEEEESTVPRTVIAVDLAKTVFEIAVSRRVGKVSEQHRVGRNRFLQFFAERKPATVVMEACGSAHHWARQLTDLGHEVKLLPRRRTCAPTCNATRRTAPTPAACSKRCATRTSGRCRSIGGATDAGRDPPPALGLAGGAHGTDQRGARPAARAGADDPGGRTPRPAAGGRLARGPGLGLPEPLRAMLSEACEEIRELSRRIKAAEAQLEALARETPAVARLRTIPGVGLLTSTALVAFVGDPHRFPSCRHFGSYLGLTPHEHSSGLRRRLGRHQQARRRLPATPVGPRSALGAASFAAARDARRAARLGAGARGAPRPQPDDGGAGRQTGARRLGGVAQRGRVRVASGGLRPESKGYRSEDLPRRARKRSERWHSGRTAVGRSRAIPWPFEALCDDWLPASGSPSWPGARALIKRPRLRVPSDPCRPPALTFGAAPDEP